MADDSEAFLVRALGPETEPTGHLQGGSGGRRTECVQLYSSEIDGLMFPDDTRGTILAIAVCYPPGGEPCPVLMECRQHALDNHESWGVWGGLSMRTRHRILMGEHPAPSAPVEHGTDAGYMRHYKHHQSVCDACRAAHTRARANQKRNPRRKRVRAA